MSRQAPSGPTRLVVLAALTNDVFRNLREALRYVAHVDSFLALGVVSLVLGVVDRVAGLPGAPETFLVFASRLTWAGYFYLVFRKSAGGSRRLPTPSDYRATWETFIYPLAQGLAAAVWYLALLGLLVQETVGFDRFVQEFQLRALDFFRQPHVLTHALLLFTLVQLPPALVASAFPETTVLPLLDPTYGIRRASQAPSAYLTTFAALQFLVVASFLTGTAAGLLEQALPVPIAAPVLRHLLQLWVSLAEARLLGDFVARSRGRRQNSLLKRHALSF